jgi:hypothetical protein
MRRALVLGRDKFKDTPNAENPKNCCWKCGKKLKPEWKMSFRPPQGDEIQRGVPYVNVVVGLYGFGTSGNNFFCTQTCAFKWALYTARKSSGSKA